MSQLPAEGGPSSEILNLVVAGMDVYDRNDRRVGKVRDVFFGSGDDAADFNSPTPAPDADATSQNPFGELAEVFTDRDETPGVLRARLLRQGYVQIDSAGLFADDRFATPDQIASVGNDRVTLNVIADELIQQ